MKFTFNWLKEHLDGDYSVDDVVLKLTSLGLEVEDVVDASKSLKDFTVAHILSTQKHPDADRLKICSVQVENGQDPIQVVCGAPNAREGLKVIFARPGVVIPSTGTTLKLGVIRGVESQGMLCSGAELLLDTESNGIMELPTDTPVGAKIIDILGLDDVMIDIAITPNRGDCLGVHGIARDLAAAGLGNLKLPPSQEAPKQGTCSTQVTLLRSECPLFLCTQVKGVKNGPSPSWLKQRLELVGQNSISLLIDLSNYFMLEFNRPCHFFDLNDIKGNLTVRGAKEGEGFTALKDVEYKLPQNAVVIEDELGIISLAGIKGGSRGCVHENTTDILIEIAHFSQDSIAQAGRKLDLHSDARYRFERYVDPHQMHVMMERLISFITQHAGGTATTVYAAGATPCLPNSIEFDAKLIQKLTGIKVPQDQANTILQDLGCKIEGAHITPPTWRSDLTLPQDLVEEVVRIVGYDHLETLSLPSSTQNTKSLEKIKFEYDSYVRKGLCARGYFETVTFSFMHSKKAGLLGADPQTSDVLIKNPISSELDMMRSSILGNLMEAVSKNQAKSITNGAFFEIGPQYENAEISGQKSMISGIKYGLAQETQWSSPSRMVDIYDIRSDLDFILENTPFSVQQTAPDWYHPGRSGTLYVNDKVLGYFGQIHPRILKEFDVKGTVVGFEVFTQNMRLSKTKGAFVKSLYQPVERDFAFLIEKSYPCGNFIKAIEDAKVKEISSVKLFDVFEGKGLEESQKSVAIRVIFESKEHTFTDAQIEELYSKVIEITEKKTGGTLRR